MAEEIQGGTPTPEVTKVEQEKTYSKAEVESMIASRVARLKEGKEHEEAMKVANEKYETLAKETETTKQELETLRNVNVKKTNLETISKLGADPDFADYIESKVEKGESPEQYAQNIQTFLEANPKFKTEKFVQIKSNPLLNNGDNDVEITNEMVKGMSVKELQKLVKAGKL